MRSQKHAIAEERNATVSNYAVPGNSYPFAMTVAKGILYIPTDKGLYALFDKGTLYALNSGDGWQKWKLDIGSEPANITIVA